MPHWHTHIVVLDTNIVVYAYDRSAGLKRRKARKILIDLWKSGLGVLSTQVIQEFFVTVTRKLPKPMGSGAGLTITILSYSTRF